MPLRPTAVGQIDGNLIGVEFPEGSGNLRWSLVGSAVTPVSSITVTGGASSEAELVARLDTIDASIRPRYLPLTDLSIFADPEHPTALELYDHITPLGLRPGDYAGYVRARDDAFLCFTIIRYDDTEELRALETHRGVDRDLEALVTRVGALETAGPANVAPVARAGEDQTVLEGESITLDSSASTDSDGTIASVRWIENGVEIGTTEQLTITSGVAGTRTITLEVTDEDGATSSDVTVITVNAAPQGYQVAAVTPLRVAPGLEGFGTDTTTGGRGGTVVVVTSTADEGPGTLHDALAVQTGDRIVLFDVSGEITMPRTSGITAGNISVYGQSAPGDGVYLRSQHQATELPFPTINVYGSNVFFQHCRFRPGASTFVNANRDAMTVGNSNTGTVNNVVFDHCTFSWATDEIIDVWYTSTNITFHRCLIYEGLYHSSSTQTGKQSYPMLLGGGSSRISVIQCVMAHGDYRMPALFSVREVDVFNNIIACYTTMPTVLQCQNRDEDLTGNIHDNLYIDSQAIDGTPFSPAAGEIVTYANVNSSGSIRLNVRRNKRVTGAPGSALTDARLHTGSSVTDESYAAYNGPAVTAPRPALIPTDQLEATLLADVGAMYPVRDSADARAIAKITARDADPLVHMVGGEVVNRTANAGGGDNSEFVGTKYDVPWPVLSSGPSRLGTAPDYVPDSWKTANGLDTSANAAITDSNGDGYTDLEDWLAGLAA